MGPGYRIREPVRTNGPGSSWLPELGRSLRTQRILGSQAACRRQRVSWAGSTLRDCSANTPLNKDLDRQMAVVVDEAQIPKLVHEMAHSRARRADHFGQRLLTDLGCDGLGPP